MENVISDQDIGESLFREKVLEVGLGVPLDSIAATERSLSSLFLLHKPSIPFPDRSLGEQRIGEEYMSGLLDFIQRPHFGDRSSAVIIAEIEQNHTVISTRKRVLLTITKLLVLSISPIKITKYDDLETDELVQISVVRDAIHRFINDHFEELHSKYRRLNG